MLPLKDSEHDAAIRGIWKLYADKDQKGNGIAVLEALKPKMDTSPVLLELLGDAYKESRQMLKKQMRYTPSG